MNLLEIDYNSIFSPETLRSLKGKSADSLRQMVGNKDLMQTMMRSQELLNQIAEAERNYRDMLEIIAVDIVSQAYPIIDYANIKIDAHIVGEGAPEVTDTPDEEEPEPDDPEALAHMSDDKKRRIINGITQGASIRGSFAYLLFREHLDDINPDLVDQYNEILKLSFGIYDDENAIAMLLAALAQNNKIAGGNSSAEFDEEDEQLTIHATALNFPMLVHEIVKGLYEILSLQGFDQDSQNQGVVDRTDKVSNEPDDLRFGKFIYDAINDIYVQSNIEDSRVRELLFVELYKMRNDEFLNFIENALNKNLSIEQKNWVKGTMADIQRDLTRDDTNLDDLDENI